MPASQSAFVRGFIDDRADVNATEATKESQSAFVRGFIDDTSPCPTGSSNVQGLNPRSCAASSMTDVERFYAVGIAVVSIRVRARLHR